MYIRILCALLILALLTGCGTVQPAPTTVPTTAPAVTEPQPTYPPHEVDYGSESSERFFPFLYTASNLGQKLELSTKGLPSTAELTDGSFYVLDKDEKTVILLEPTGVSLHLETPNTVFYVLDGHSILQADYLGHSSQVLYTGTGEPIEIMERLGSRLYFAEGGNVTLLELTTGEAIPLFQASQVDTLLPLTPQLLLWKEGKDEHRLYDHDLKETQTLSRMEYNFLRSALSMLGEE